MGTFAWWVALRPGSSELEPAALLEAADLFIVGMEPHVLEERHLKAVGSNLEAASRLPGIDSPLVTVK